jgi:glycine betaine/choline ABC-type transport system substrate-binding protein
METLKAFNTEKSRMEELEANSINYLNNGRVDNQATLKVPTTMANREKIQVTVEGRNHVNQIKEPSPNQWRS